MNNQAQNLYIKTQINTANPGELTLMLYNGCLKFMKQALEGISSNDYNLKNVNIQKSLDILDELIITLKPDYEISSNLRSLYVFIKEQLSDANIHLNQDSLQIGIDLMTELRDTWAEALKKVKVSAKVGS